MQTTGSATTFHVADVEASVQFYTEVLGFTKRFQFGDYAGVELGVVQIHLSGPKATNRRQEGQGSIYIFCDEVDVCHAGIIARGGRSQAPPRDYEYGMRDFVVEDPDGNLVAFGCESVRGEASQ